MEPPPECPQETPALAEENAKFLNLIGPGELERCLFTETLDVVAAEAQPRDAAWGQRWVSARWAPYERAGEPVRSCLLVQAGCRCRQDGVPASSSLKAYVTPEMETLEQEEQECLEVTGVAVPCSLFLCPAPVSWDEPCSDAFLEAALHTVSLWCPLPSSDIISVLTQWSPSPTLGGSWGRKLLTMHLDPHGEPPAWDDCNEDPPGGRGGWVSLQAEPQCWSFIYSRAELQGLLPEGASLLLLRVLACRREVPPGLVFPTINTEGHLCTASYRALGVQPQAVGSAEAEVFVIERAVHAGAGASTVWHSSFLPSGRLARLVQVGSPMVMRLQDEPVPAAETDGVKTQPPFPKQPLDWEEDIQLFSWFLDRKGELQEYHAAYIQQHPELQVLLSNFLLALLLQQPQDPVSFAAEFFAHKEPPETRFTSSRAANCSPSPSHPVAKGE
ncbi:ciliogenesis-associated TTC17-interacting protein [Amazona ochrocephala]